MPSRAGSQSSGGKLGIVSSLNTAGPVRYAQRPAVTRPDQPMGATQPARLASDHQLPRGAGRTPEHTSLIDHVAALQEVESILAAEFEEERKELPTTEEGVRHLSPQAVDEELRSVVEETIKYPTDEEDMSPPPPAVVGDGERESLQGQDETAVSPSVGGVRSHTSAVSSPVEREDDMAHQSLAVSYCTISYHYL